MFGAGWWEEHSRSRCDHSHESETQTSQWIRTSPCLGRKSARLANDRSSSLALPPTEDTHVRYAELLKMSEPEKSTPIGMIRLM